MPNGGSDCCGTRWFNRANGGRAGSVHHDPSIPSYCEIRELRRKDPFYTYCSNHPYRMQRRVEVPLGPVYIDAGGSAEREDGAIEFWSGRDHWLDAPDTPEVRDQLLELLSNHDKLHDAYSFYGNSLVQVIIDECERLREPRIIPILERIGREFRGDSEDGERVRKSIQDAIARIEKAVREAPGG